MNKLKDNMNYVSDPVGRKWVISKIPFIGSLTLLNCVSFVLTILLFIPLFFIKNISIISVVLTLLLVLFLEFILIIETSGVKNFEILIKYIKLLISPLEKFYSKETTTSNSNVYEVLNGFDINNLSLKDIEQIEEDIVDFVSGLKKGNIKIFKVDATLRLANYLNNLIENISKEKNPYKSAIKTSYFENINKFKNSSMFNIFLEFNDVSEEDIHFLLTKIGGGFEYKKQSKEEWNAIKIINFGVEETYKIKKSCFKNQKEEFIASALEFGRNLPSFWLQELLFNEDIPIFVLNFKNPNFKESEKIKKDIKRWSKQVMRINRDHNQKDLKKYKEDVERSDAQDSIFENVLFGKDDLKFMQGFAIFKRNKESKYSISRQFSELNYLLEKKYNISLKSGISEQKNILNSIFSNENFPRWFPVNSHTIAYSMPFQNLTILEENGIYLGLTDELYPCVLNIWGDNHGGGKHTGIIGSTGSGKSILMQTMLAGLSVMEEDSLSYVLDPKNSGFGDAILHKFGGKTIDLAQYSINPLAFFGNVNEKNVQEKINSKSIEIEEFLHVLFSRETEHATNLNLISQLSDDIKIFFEGQKKNLIKGKEFTFSDIQKSIKGKKYEFILKKLIKGTYDRFNCKNNFVFEEKTSYVFELLEILNLENAISNASLFLIMNMVMDQIYFRQDKNSKLSLFIDEAGDFLKSDYLRVKLERLMVKARSFKTKIIWATQNVTDLLGDNNKALNSIFANTEYIFLGQVKDNQIQSLNNVFSGAEMNTLSYAEKEHIKESNSLEQKGNFILIQKTKKTLLKVDYLNMLVLRSWIEETKIKRGMD